MIPSKQNSLELFINYSERLLKAVIMERKLKMFWRLFADFSLFVSDFFGKLPNCDIMKMFYECKHLESNEKEPLLFGDSESQLQ